MSNNLDHLIKRFGPTSLKPTKKELNLFVKESLVLINEINNFYKKYFEERTFNDGTLGKSILSEVEDRINKISNLYQKYFIDEDDNTWNSMVSDVQDFIGNIKKYHQELLEWTDSIQNSIKCSYNKIEELYAYLFSKVILEEDEDYTHDWFVEGDIRSEKLKKYIADLKSSYEKIEWSENGYRQAIESFYDYLYKKGSNWISNAEKTKTDIATIQNFRDKDYDRIVWEIEQAKRDVNSLVNAATAGSLVEWYEKSKSEYKLTDWSFERIRVSSESWELTLLWEFLIILGKVSRNFERIFLYYWAQLLNYALFILPLLSSVIVFIQPELFSRLGIDIKSTSDWNELSFLNRLIISIPLRWISLFWQRNISQRKRIAEEYNHKIQVLKMYLNFTTNDSQYLLDETIKQELQKEVLEVIKRRPGDIYWKDESMFDKVISFFKILRNTP